MKFYSTKGKAPEVDFKTALFNGIAPDGGLYMPKKIPHITQGELQHVESLQDTGFLVLRKFIHKKEISDNELAMLVKKALIFPVPLVKVGEYSILELFHGPTMAFKDFAAGVLAQLFEFFLSKENRKITLLVATSGDTGGAMAQAFSGLKQVKMVILYPQGKVSELQEEQLTRVGENVRTVAVDGVFDECQQFVKQAFGDNDLLKLHLSSANSINIGRLLPQIIYYVWTCRQIHAKKLRFVIPSGNLGNATAAVLAKKMGMPISSIIIATNENDAAVEYYKTGVYHGKDTVQTLSTAMDIGKPNNFERILSLFDHDYESFRKLIEAVKVSDAETIQMIKDVYLKQHYIIDFHTAVGFSAGEQIHSNGLSTVIVSTASSVKFAKEIGEETGIAVDNSRELLALRKRKKRVINAKDTYEAIKQVLISDLIS